MGQPRILPDCVQAGHLRLKPNYNSKTTSENCASLYSARWQLPAQLQAELHARSAHCIHCMLVKVSASKAGIWPSRWSALEAFMNRVLPVLHAKCVSYPPLIWRLATKAPTRSLGIDPGERRTCSEL